MEGECERFVDEELGGVAECVDGRYVSLDFRGELARAAAGDFDAAAARAVREALEAAGLYAGEVALSALDTADLGGGRRAVVFDLQVLSPGGEVLADGVAEVAFVELEGGELLIDEAWATLYYEHARRLRELAARAR